MTGPGSIGLAELDALTVIPDPARGRSPMS